MNAQASAVWAGLEFRLPMMRRNVEPLSEDQMRWSPAPGRVSIAWQLWHIAEVEDVWVGTLTLNEQPRFPFGVQVRQATEDNYPTKQQLLDYMTEVREISRLRLEAMTDRDFDHMVQDKDYDRISVRDIWAGVVTSFAWHAGQIALTAKLLPDTPVSTMKFDYWKT